MAAAEEEELNVPTAVQHDTLLLFSMTCQQHEKMPTTCQTLHPSSTHLPAAQCKGNDPAISTVRSIASSLWLPHGSTKGLQAQAGHVSPVFLCAQKQNYQAMISHQHDRAASVACLPQALGMAQLCLGRFRQRLSLFGQLQELMQAGQDQCPELSQKWLTSQSVSGMREQGCC